MASTYLTSNIGSPSQQRFTWSLWVKRSKLGVEQHMVGNYNANNRTHLFFTNTEKLYFYSELSGSNVIAYQTNRLFRDLNAWYHIVCAVDTTQAGGNRIRIYVNGEEETSFATETECNQNTNLSIGTTHYIGTYGGDAGSASYSFDGSMSHLHFVDGSQLTPSSFGSTDSTTGEWKINTAPSVTYGSSGYFILKDGNSVTDQSGNSNNFTVGGGTLTNTEDCPSNVFATLNPLWKDTVSAGAITYSNGNTSFHPNIDGNSFTRSTLGASSGKYYIEIKATEVNTGQSTSMNIVPSDEYGASHSSSGTYGFQIQLNSTNTQLKKEVEGSSTTINSSFSSGSIAMMAVDLDNGKMWIGYNGTWYNNNNPSSTLDTNNPDITGIATSVDYLIGFRGYMQGGYPSGYYNQANVNFGNGYFGTTAVSSAGTNASGIGIFEYDVPTGYTALSTKGLNL